MVHQHLHDDGSLHKIRSVDTDLRITGDMISLSDDVSKTLI